MVSLWQRWGAGDKVKNVMWRMQNGELPSEHPPKVIVLQAGGSEVAGELSHLLAWRHAYGCCGTLVGRPLCRQRIREGLSPREQLYDLLSSVMCEAVCAHV